MHDIYEIGTFVNTYDCCLVKNWQGGTEGNCSIIFRKLDFINPYYPSSIPNICDTLYLWVGEKQQHPRAHISRISTKIPLFTISCFDYHLGTKRNISMLDKYNGHLRYDYLNNEQHFNQSRYLLNTNCI